MIFVFIVASVLAQEVLQEFNFAGYTGAGFNAGGTGGKLDTNYIRARLSSVNTAITAYGDAAPSDTDLGRGLIKYADRVNSSQVGVGGIAAIELASTGQRALYLQQASTV